LELIKKNIFWLFFDKTVRVIIGLFVGVWIAKYLGPEKFGTINYSLAIIGLFGPLISLGLNEVVVKELINEPDQKHNLIGSTFVAQIFSSVLSFFLILVIIILIEPDKVQRNVTYILAISLPFQSSNAIKYYFESIFKGYNSNLIELTVFVIFTLLRIYSLLNKYGLYIFVLLTLFETIFSFILLLFWYQYLKKDIFNWSPSLSKIKDLLNKSYPLILSGFAVILYMRMDQILIGHMIGKKELGIYSSALRFSEIMYTIPIVIMSTIFPKIVKLKKENFITYSKYFKNVLKALTIISFFIIITITFSSNFIFKFFYGDEFLDGSLVLKIHIWTSTFVFLGIAGSKWYLTENLQKLIIIQTCIGAILNLLLNLFLIPKFGIAGSAFSTLFAQILSTYMFDLFYKKTRILFNYKSEAIFYSIPWFFNYSIQILKKILIFIKCKKSL
jgi:PST family polysaccharide transporter